jgi:nucleotide-binding universal stress UspA family protein
MAIHRILFPVDFSDACAAMTPIVERTASIASAEVTLLHVLEPPSSGFELWVRPLREAERDLRLVAREKLHSFLQSEFPYSPRVLVEGEAGSRIAQVAREHHFDLIIMPSHANVFRRMLLGSTTAKVLNDADCPVMTTRHAETISPRPIEHRKWLCAVGLQEDSKRVLRYSIESAKAFGSNLKLVHVISASDTRGPIEIDHEEELQTEEGKTAHRRIEEFLKEMGSHAPIHIIRGPIKDSLTEAASRFAADILAIGRSPQSGSLGRMRDLTYVVVRDAPCPVLSV